MCHFITLIAPTDDIDAVSAVMARHGRAARPMDNPSVRKVLREGERQYLTTRGHCDCGSVLATAQVTPEMLAQKQAAEEAQMRRKGWSNAKIARALGDRRKAEANPPGGRKRDSFELWEAALADLRRDLRLPRVGLLIRFYSGGIEDDCFKATRRELRAADLRAALATMKEDEATIFC